MYVSAKECPGDRVRIRSMFDTPEIRVIERELPGDTADRPGHVEYGYESGPAFERGLRQHLPKFYDCERFEFKFERAGLWPQADAFDVVVDSAGIIRTVSELRDAEF